MNEEELGKLQEGLQKELVKLQEERKEREAKERIEVLPYPYTEPTGQGINLNDSVKVKLSEVGHQAISEKNKYMNEGYEHVEYQVDYRRETDSEGYTHYLLWELFNIFGSKIGIGKETPFENNEIIVVESKRT